VCYKLVLSEIVREAKWIIRIVCYGPSLLRGLLAVYLCCLSTSLSNQKILCVRSLVVWSNLDAVSESRKSTVRPTASTILWNVLIETVREVAHAVNVAPAKGVRQILRLDILIRQRGSVGISDLVSLENLKKQQNAWHGMACSEACVCVRERVSQTKQLIGSGL
jgi:hypothetical protein